MAEGQKLTDAQIEELSFLHEMWMKHQLREQEARLSLGTDNSRELLFGPNVKREEAVRAQAKYVKDTTENKQNTFAEAFSNFNILMEGETSGFVNPGGNSGWTVGQGIDIGHTSREDAIALGMPTQLVELADKHKAWGVLGKPVPKTVQKIQADVNTPEWSNFRHNVAQKKVPLMEQIAKTNPNLSTRAVVTLAQMDHWSGGIFNETPEATKLNRSEVSLKTQGQQTSKTEGLINPIAQYLQTGNATDQGLTEVIHTIQQSYGDRRPLNSTTMERYKSFLTTGSA